jgi:hypothetical protein
MGECVQWDLQKQFKQGFILNKGSSFSKTNNNKLCQNFKGSNHNITTKCPKLDYIETNVKSVDYRIRYKFMLLNMAIIEIWAYILCKNRVHLGTNLTNLVLQCEYIYERLLCKLKIQN